MTWIGVAENLVSDVLFVLLGIVAGFLWLRLSRRNALLRFFGVDKTRQLVIYVSNLAVRRLGATGVDGRPHTYQGLAVSYAETQVADHFRDLFNYPVPSLSERPGLLSRLLVSDVTVRRLPSPPHMAEVECLSPIIALGSPAYNAASQLIESWPTSRVRVQLGEVDESGPPVSPHHRELAFFRPEAEKKGQSGPRSSGSSAGQSPGLVVSQPAAIVVEGAPPMKGSLCGFVERVIDNEHNRVAFYAAGTSELATTGAAHFLLSEWARLRRWYGDESGFVVVLRFDPKDYRQWSIRFEKRE